MPAAVSWNVEATVKPGQMEAFKGLMTEMVVATRENEPGALRYEWFVDGDSVHILETYADSAAGLTHLANLGARFLDRFLAVLDITRIAVYGEPSPELRGALAGFGASFHATLGGFRR